MSKPLRIGPVQPSTPAGTGLAWGARHALPEDLLREASRRLSHIALLGAVLWTVGRGSDHLVNAWVLGNPAGLELGSSDVIAGASVVLSLALFFYARRSNRDPQFILDLGLVYLVVTAFALGNLFHWAPSPSDRAWAPMISWIGVCCLLLASIVPNTPGKTLIAGLLAASMNPLGMLIARARGMWDFGPTKHAFVMHYPDYVLVGVAVAISVVVTRLGQQVIRAREMGSYRLGELLGKGGMGEVYRATHRMLARPAAIKLIRPEVLGESSPEGAKVAVSRFRREADAAASLRSPHTVALYDFGVTEDQTLYFVMELLDGMDLETLVRQKGPLPAARVIYILRQVCESLEEAHQRGMVHRDIKPANIHLGRLGLRHDFVKVLDFGLVKSAANAGTEQSIETGVGMTPGTPAYLAPEMALGERFDGRADLYALGCVAYYLLTGRLVFEASAPIQMIARHLHDTPVPPSQRAELPVPAALDELVLACLAKKPEDRPRSAAALARSLAAIDAGSTWDEERAIRWWQINQPGIGRTGSPS
ncbi:MAG TPA: serine/threonine-protein kinase [Solirubrobacterales bacterium]|nr:serine/threonine-protein kinase [Solirubrobacterales bacterium]